MSAKGSGGGTLERRGDRVYAKIQRADGSRPRIPWGVGITDEEARAKLDAFIAEGKATGKLEAMIDWKLKRSANTKRGKQAAEGRLTTVKEIGEAYTDGSLFKQHGPVNGLRALSHQHNTTGYNMSRVLRKRAYQVKVRGETTFGDLPAVDVTHTDIAKVMAAQKGSAQSRNHVHNGLSRILSLAEIPLGLRKPGTNPVLKAYRAPKDPDKHFNFLYPAEVMALLGNTDIPLGRRVLYLLACYFGWRKGTLMAFDWSGIDWTHGTVSVFHQKGHARLGGSGDDDGQGTPIFFKIDMPGVLAVLKAWWIHCGKPTRGDVIVGLRGAALAKASQRGRPRQFEESWRENHEEADILRADLKASGVTRAILFKVGRNVQMIRFHDFRATFCTWARRAGRGDVWTTERTGHTPTSSMLKRYTRMAQTLMDLGYEPFPDATNAIPELAPVKLRAVR